MRANKKAKEESGHVPQEYDPWSPLHKALVRFEGSSILQMQKQGCKRKFRTQLCCLAWLWRRRQGG